MLFVLLVASASLANMWPAPGPGRADYGGAPPAGGTDYTADARFIGCWLMGDTTDDSTSFGADHCTADSSATPTDDATWSGDTFTTVASVPAGTDSRTMTAHFDGNADHFTASDLVAYESPNFTAGCWVRVVDTSTQAMISKSFATAWQLNIKSSDSNAYIEGSVETTSLLTTDLNEWGWHGVRWDSEGVEADADDGRIEGLVTGLEYCSGQCSPEAGPMTGNADALTMGESPPPGNQDLEGDLMECFYADVPLPNDDLAEIMLCGLDGQEDGAARDAQFGNASCTGSGAPWNFCTGLDTGTGPSCANAAVGCCS
jgi:hypothetical protein